MSRVTADEKQSERNRGADQGDENPGVIVGPRRCRRIDIFCALDSLWRELERPGNDERNRESDRHREDDEPHDPLGNLQEW